MIREWRKALLSLNYFISFQPSSSFLLLLKHLLYSTTPRLNYRNMLDQEILFNYSIRFEKEKTVLTKVKTWKLWLETGRIAVIERPNEDLENVTVMLWWINFLRINLRGFDRSNELYKDMRLVRETHHGKLIVISFYSDTLDFYLRK